MAREKDEVRTNRGTIRAIAICSGLFISAHAAGLFLFPAHAEAVTYPFLVLAPLIASCCCYGRGMRRDHRDSLSWFLFSLGLFLWTLAMSFSAWEDLARHTPFSVAFASDFVYFLYGIPLLLAISLPADVEQLPLFVWLDGVQAVFTATLIYVFLFNAIPFFPQPMQPLSIPRVVWTYDAENLLLAGVATLRLIEQRKYVRERPFYQVVCGFLLVYGTTAAVYNHVSAVTEGHALDPLVDVPFLLLALATLLDTTAETTVREEELGRGRLGRLIDDASPFFYTLALSTLGALVLRQHFYIGLSAIAVAIIVYGIRTISLQGRLLSTQHALTLASARLEALSLQDALTGVANRRCFDQRYVAEWNKAVRGKHPISLLLIDIDYFKRLNDTYGHPEGDRCLIAVAAVMQSVLVRSGDLLARYGGEEFVVLLPDTDSSGALRVATGLQKAVRSLSLQRDGSASPHVTISIGVATAPDPHGSSSDALLRLSDGALYKAKQNGRNRIEGAD
jgi:diguanylate cyclase (GGDEF)-like protein